MDHVHYKEANLNIYVNPGHGSIVGMHMVNTQGYRVVNPYGDDGLVTLNLGDSLDHIIIMAAGAAQEVIKVKYFQCSIHLLYNMEHITEGGRTLCVQVIVTSDCVFHTIMSFHSSECNVTAVNPSHSSNCSVCDECHHL